MKFSQDLWFGIARPRPKALMSILCFHHAGGSALGFRDWGPRISRNVEIIAIQLPGRENRWDEQFVRDPEIILNALTQSLSGLLDRPYAVFGHSMGAILGYTFVRRLLQINKVPPPTRLIVSAAPAPGFSFSTGSTPLTSTTSDDQLIAALDELDGTPPEILNDRDAASVFLPALRADLDLTSVLLEMPASPINVPISALYALNDQLATREDVESWTTMSTRECKLHPLPGGHFYFQKAARLEMFDIINGALEHDLRSLASCGSDSLVVSADGTS